MPDINMFYMFSATNDKHGLFHLYRIEMVYIDKIPQFYRITHDNNIKVECEYEKRHLLPLELFSNEADAVTHIINRLENTSLHIRGEIDTLNSFLEDEFDLEKECEYLLQEDKLKFIREYLNTDRIVKYNKRQKLIKIYEMIEERLNVVRNTGERILRSLPESY